MNATTGMFGMLDYRASKLYRLLSFPLRLVCNIGGFLFLAACVYFTGQHFTGYPSPIAHFLLMAVTATIGSILWWLFLVSVGALFNKVFFFLIDVVPAEGRTQEQAVAVVKLGNAARYAFHLDNHFMDWTDDDSRGYVRSQALSLRLLYGNKLRQQINAIAQALRDAKKEGLNRYDTAQRVTAAKGKTGWCEKLVVNRGWFRDYGFLLAVFALYYYFGLG